MTGILSIKHIKLSALAIAVVLAVFSLERAQQIDVSGRGETLAERIGTDDQAVLAIQFGGDLNGNLDTCG
jgi:hypothetical protein